MTCSEAPLIILLNICLVATACAEAPLRTITVTGSSEIQAIPDQVLIIMTAKTRSQNLLEAQSNNNGVVKNLLGYLRNDIKVRPADVQTKLFTLIPEYYQLYQNDITTSMESDFVDAANVSSTAFGQINVSAKVSITLEIQ